MLRLLTFGCLMLGTLYTVYHYVDGGPDYTAEMQRIVDEFNNETEVGMRQINELEAKLMDIDIQPRPDAQYVVYNRVPKCASMSMTTLCYKLGGANTFKVESPYEVGEKPLKSRLEQEEFIDYLKAQEPYYMYIRHQYYIDFSEMNEEMPSVYINMIRDPIARFESFYYFSRFGNVKGGGGKANLPEVQRLESVDQCVERRRKECTQPVWQVIPYLCGMDHICQERGRPALEQAKRNVEQKFLFVGVLEELPLSLKILEKLLPRYFAGAHDLSQADASQKMKEETVTLQKQPASEKTREFLMTETSLMYEYELYNFVVDRIRRIQHKYNIKV